MGGPHGQKSVGHGPHGSGAYAPKGGSKTMTLNDLERRNSPYFAFFHQTQ